MQPRSSRNGGLGTEEREESVAAARGGRKEGV